MWPEVASILIFGFLCLGRSFAYWGIPRWHIFVGEVMLALFLLAGPRSQKGRWPWAGMELSSLRRLTKLLLLLLGYGIFQVLRGWSLGNPPIVALRDLAFDYYPLYFFLGLWVGLRKRGQLSCLVRQLAWVNGIYGLMFILFLSRIPWEIGGVSTEVASVPVFGQPEHSAVVLLGLLTFEQDLGKAWHLLALNAFVLLGMQIRAAWVAFGVGLIVWAWLSKRLARMALGAATVGLLLGVLYLADVQLSGPATRGGSSISARDIVGRALAPVSPGLAARYSANFQTYEDTAVWRTAWWVAIWGSAHERATRALFGHGYGFALGDLVPYLEGTFIRTPHSFFFYALGYTGWTGVALFLLFQAEIVHLLWRSWQENAGPFGLVFWSATMTYASFSAFFEAPYGAIPFYLITGWTAAPLLYRKRPSELWEEK